MSPPTVTNVQPGLLGSSHVIRASKAHEREQIRIRDLWDKGIQNSTKYVRYKSTIVCMLSWKDSDLNKEALDQEVEDLATVFRDCYGFQVVQYVMDSKDNPRRRLNRYLSEFVDEHDDEENLLILYYAGHGWDARHLPQRKNKNIQSEFLLSDKATVEVTEMEKAQVSWLSAEWILFQANADILAIFDCCDAGSLASARGPLRFEYLGACLRGDTTKPAGPESFTSALIWALRQLKDEQGSWFSTARLQHKIREAPNFPQDQTPVLGPCILQDDSIVISPAPQTLSSKAQKVRETQRQNIKRTGEFLDLRFRYDTLDDKTVEQTAQALRRLIGDNKIQASEITFIEKHERNDPRLPHFVRKVMHAHSEGQLRLISPADPGYAPILEGPEVAGALATPSTTVRPSPDHDFDSGAEQQVGASREEDASKGGLASDLDVPGPQTQPMKKRKNETSESPRRQSTRVKKHKS